MTYKVAQICIKYDQIFKDRLKNTSELVISLSNGSIKNFSVDIDVENQLGIVSLLENNKKHPLICFMSGNSKKMSEISNSSEKISCIRSLLSAIFKLIVALNRKLQNIAKQSFISYNQDDWEVIYKMSHDNKVVFNDKWLEKPKDVYTQFELDRDVPEDIILEILRKCGIENIPPKEISDKYNNDYSSILNDIERNIIPTNESTEKGLYNRGREIIDTPNSFVKIRKFDPNKDFTVRELIKALMKFDLDLPVNVVASAPGIGLYDMHIHKIEKSFLNGYDRDEAASLFIDDSH